MTFNQVRELAKKLRSPEAETREAIEAWHRHEDSMAFLAATTEGDVPVYISDAGAFIYGVVVRHDRLCGDYEADLLRCGVEVPSGYGYGYSLSDPPEPPYLDEPMDGTGAKVLDGSDPLFFRRPFHGVDSATPIEINQRLSHYMGLHAMPDRQAWCSLSRLGEIVPVARHGNLDDDGGGTCCTIRRRELDLLLYVMQASLIRVFYLYRSWPLGAWDYDLPMTEEIARNATPEASAKRQIYRADGQARTSILKGFQILRCGKSPEEMSLVISGREPREYATFRIHDFKHNRVVEWPADPQRLGNYFVESDLPYSTSPAFFTPEVLMDCRNNPERFVIEERIVRCKGVWQVRYDVNSEGLVHVYICDLADLPCEEQLRWKRFNVEPSGGISERALKTDFEGDWDESYDPLRSLKDTLKGFPTKDRSGRPCHIWAMPSLSNARDIDFLGYVLTGQQKEWEDQVLALNQILVEGLSTKRLRKLAQSHDCDDPKLGSIKLLDRVLRAAGIEDEPRGLILSPLIEVQRLRSPIAHAGDASPAQDLRAHYRTLIEQCDAAMKQLAELVRSGALLPPE